MHIHADPNNTYISKLHVCGSAITENKMNVKAVPAGFSERSLANANASWLALQRITHEGIQE